MSILDKLKFRLLRTMTPTAGTPSPHRHYKDPNSASNFNDFQTKHLSLDWNVDFNGSVIQGRAKLSIKTLNSSAPQIKLDGLGLDVKSVSYDGNPLSFVVTKDKFGDVLSIPAPRSESFDLVIDYETTDKCSAVQWLKPEQTSGGKYPYLFTQCQVPDYSSCSRQSMLELWYPAKTLRLSRVLLMPVLLFHLH